MLQWLAQTDIGRYLSAAWTVMDGILWWRVIARGKNQSVHPGGVFLSLAIRAGAGKYL